jgi:hypothetical protein
LWGLGLVEVQGTSRSSATRARAFEALSDEDEAALLAFLRSL